jgi:hypothetical protein
VRHVVLSRHFMESTRSCVWPVAQSFAYPDQKHGRTSSPAHFCAKFCAIDWHSDTSALPLVVDASPFVGEAGADEPLVQATKTPRTRKQASEARP